MNTTQTNKGFTIIEVVLVLAIAGLIFLMVFIALPALQRGQRDSQRKSDVSRINTQISNYASANRGQIPPATNSATAPIGIIGTGGFVTKYLGGTAANTAGNEYADPKTGSGYVFVVTANNSLVLTEGQVHYLTNRICGSDGDAAASYDGVTANARNYVLRIKLENQASAYCIDNR